MRAMILDKPGAALRLADIPIPEPGPGQLRVKVQYMRRLPDRPARRRR